MRFRGRVFGLVVWMWGVFLRKAAEDFITWRSGKCESLVT